MNSFKKTVSKKVNLSHLMPIFLTAELRGKLILNKLIKTKQYHEECQLVSKIDILATVLGTKLQNLIHDRNGSEQVLSNIYQLLNYLLLTQSHLQHQLGFSPLRMCNKLQKSVIKSLISALIYIKIEVSKILHKILAQN